MHLGPALTPTPVVYTAVLSKAVVLLLLIYCLLLLSLFVGVLWLVLVLLFSALCCYHLDEEERPGCKCSTTLPRGAVGWSAVCGCGIS